jgi:epoxide hydrolase 4
MHDTPPVEHRYAEVNGVRLHYAQAGTGPLLLFLHGFPQCWYEFRRQFASFAADHTVVAPDQRGYNLSSKPAELWRYGVWPAVEDVQALVRHLGFDRFVLVGHDWGGAVAWSFALHYPEMLDGLVVLSMPHPALFDRALHDDPEQQQASRYMLVFRRRNAASMLAADDYARLRVPFDMLPALGEADCAVYRQAWAEPGALDSMLAWYRREGLGPEERGTPARGNYVPEIGLLTVRVPTLVIYGDADPYLRPSCHRGLDTYVSDLAFRTIAGAGHWLCDECPDLVDDTIRDWLAARQPPGG